MHKNQIVDNDPINNVQRNTLKKMYGENIKKNKKWEE